MQTNSFSHLRRASVAGALALAAAGLTLPVAAGPARAQEAPLTVGDWVTDVEGRIARELRTPAESVTRNHGSGRAHVVLTLNADGEVVDRRISKRSRNPAIDAEVMRVARALGPLPALPVGLRGKPVAVELQIYLGSDPDGQTPARMRQEAHAHNESLSTRLAEAEAGTRL